MLDIWERDYHRLHYRYPDELMETHCLRITKELWHYICKWDYENHSYYTKRDYVKATQTFFGYDVYLANSICGQERAMSICEKPVNYVACYHGGINKNKSSIDFSSLHPSFDPIADASAKLQKALYDNFVYKFMKQEEKEDMKRNEFIYTNNLLGSKVSIKKVIFNNPATIVIWSDDSKTVVKAENEPYDKEKGLAMAIAKRSLGNAGNYYNLFSKWLKEEKDDESKNSENNK